MIPDKLADMIYAEMVKGKGAKDIAEIAREYAKETAIRFFKWYFIKQNNFQFYFREVKPITTSQEIEEKITEIEGKPIEEIFQVYLKETDTTI